MGKRCERNWPAACCWQKEAAKLRLEFMARDWRFARLQANCLLALSCGSSPFRSSHSAFGGRKRKGAIPSANLAILFIWPRSPLAHSRPTTNSQLTTPNCLLTPVCNWRPRKPIACGPLAFARGQSHAGRRQTVCGGGVGLLICWRGANKNKNENENENKK